MKLSLYFHTVRHLKPIQIWFQLWYRMRSVLRKLSGYKYNLSIEAQGRKLKLSTYIDKPQTLFPPDRFIFLNIECSFKGWDDDRFGALWKYNLNYMDYIIQEGSDFEMGTEWINRFIRDFDHNNCGKDPYPISLRAINWIKFMTRYRTEIPDDDRNIWDSSLRAQYSILLDKLEYNILGNHLLENACSLLWGGIYFSDLKLYRKADRLLQKLLVEQVLPDGGHFELSPMYHCILLDRLLDCINIAENNHLFDGQRELTDFMRSKATDMLGWIAAIRYEDNTIPLLNDSAYGIAPSVQELFEYANSLSLTWGKADLRESGYRKFNNEHCELIVDVGEIGPSYIPGHAHADTFSYELRISGKPFIIDSGISTYEKDERRAYQRSTAAHNTVTIGNGNSSEVWGGFRVARRAHITSLSEQTNKIKAAHNGFKRYGIIHERSWVTGGTQIKVIDKISGNKPLTATGTFIFHPDVKIESVTKEKIVTSMATIDLSNVKEISCENVDISRYYNRLESTVSIRMRFEIEMECKITEFALLK